MSVMVQSSGYVPPIAAPEKRGEAEMRIVIPMLQQVFPNAPENAVCHQRS